VLRFNQQNFTFGCQNASRSCGGHFARKTPTAKLRGEAIVHSAGLKIRCTSGACGFESHPRHKSKLQKKRASAEFISAPQNIPGFESGGQTKGVE
jgi:hypothetical protein